jgi:GntR family transcriptional regulator, transcriptional repressor for pyruvate dehydrogenase complex
VNNIFNSIGNKGLLSQKVAAEIEEAILSRKLPPGEKLPAEFELCSQFGVSRTAVREALRILNAVGLVSIEKGKGTFVSHLSTEHVVNSMRKYLEILGSKNSVLEVMQARLIIEPAICKTAAMNNPVEIIEKMKQNLKEMRINVDQAEHVRLDVQFHQQIAEASGNNIMPLILNPIHQLMPSIKKDIIDLVPGAKESALAWHTKIVEAIEEGEPQKAYLAMQGHLNLAYEQAEQMIKTIAGTKEPD